MRARRADGPYKSTVPLPVREPNVTLDEVLDGLGNWEDVTDEGTGVTVRYIHDPKLENSSHSYSARANAATGSTTFCALVYKDERYDFRTQKVWSSVAPTFGIPLGSKVLTVEISCLTEAPTGRVLRCPALDQGPSSDGGRGGAWMISRMNVADVDWAIW